MKTSKSILFLLIALQTGCASVTKDDIYSLQRQINDLQSAVSNLKRATETDLARLGTNDTALLSRFQQQEAVLEPIRKKIESFCVVTKNGRWEEFRSTGDGRCNVR